MNDGMNTDAEIVVGYDGSPDSLAAISWAANMASLRGEGIVVTTIIDPRETPRGTTWPSSYWDEIEERARGVLADCSQVPVRFKRLGGHLVPRLVEVARAGSMLVVGSHGHGLVAEILRGSVSQSAARHAPVPCVVVRPPLHPESGRIVVGVDGSESAGRALEFACEIAQVTGDKIFALRAWQPDPVATERYDLTPPNSGGSLHSAEAALSQVLADGRRARPEIPIAGDVIHSAASRALLDASDTASMVVVGTRGHSGVGEVFLGSVSKAVLHKAHCPVAVVH
jgi:nucleotide-binding universal stress UspA family protein